MDASDFYKLIGFLYYASLVKLPSKCAYWYQLCQQQIVVDNITRNRVGELLRTLHFNNNILNKEKCDKIQPLINLFSDRCKSLVHQEEYIAIDEQMVGFKGKTAPASLKQYMPNKPSKHGFKLWSKSGVSGFVYTIVLYAGSTQAVPTLTTTMSNNSLTRKTRLVDKVLDESEKIEHRKADTKAVGVSGMVVVDLVKDAPRGTKVFADNFFGSVALIRKLTELGLGITCTLRSNRIKNCPLPSEEEMDKKNRGCYDYRITNGKKCALVAWKDSKRVIIGPNYIAVNPVVELVRWDKTLKQKLMYQLHKLLKNITRTWAVLILQTCCVHYIQFILDRRSDICVWCGAYSIL
jgi:hypothetical protein